MSALQKDELRDIGLMRAVIEHVTPEVDGGRFPIKRVQGQSVGVEADVFTDGHEAVRCVLQYRTEGAATWSESEMALLENDRWRGEFELVEIGRYRYTLTAWVDRFLSWRRDFERRVDAEDVAIALAAARQMIADAAMRAVGADAEELRALCDVLDRSDDITEKSRVALSDALLLLMTRYPDRRFACQYERQLSVVVDRRLAGFGSWYEMFPRSASSEPGRHGTFADCAARLPYIASMGFDVLYLPPIHPVGRVYRKGCNNALDSKPGDVGSVWAIGALEGGHKSLLAELGTLADLRALREEARRLDIEIALDLAFQCAPDHPYVREHPSWFRHRPDGSIQFAENPPKKYQDIYPFDFDSADWRDLWRELRSVVDFWIAQGFVLFRVDNPHTKPFAFWEWLIDSVKRDHPEVLFLSEAFTRPKVMHRLAKLGFSQSYTYFTWRNTKRELTEYFTELSQSETREYFRPNCWPNTPDILPAYLQRGSRPAFMARLVLAATLSGNYGIYGPAFELFEHRAVETGSEEYLDSEKYQLRWWNIDSPESLHDFIAVVNRIRRENAALWTDWNLRFISVDNDALLCFAKVAAGLSNIVLVVVNLDVDNARSGWVEFDVAEFGIAADQPYQMIDLLSGKTYFWQGGRNFVILDPAVAQAHIFQLRKAIA
jgi:starch synthase (maltosyl-transferring)